MATPARESAGSSGASSARGRGRPAATDSRDTRARILDAALRLFGNGSYAAVSMVAVGAESGVDKRTVRYHFGSKRELFVAARAEAFRRFVAEARRQVFSQDTARGRLKGWVDAYRNLHAFDTDVVRFMGFAVAEGVTEPANQVSMVEAGSELFGMLAQVIEDGMASGELNPALDVAAAVQMVSAISIGMSLMSMSPGPFPETLDALDLVFAGDFFTEPARSSSTRSVEVTSGRRSRSYAICDATSTAAGQHQTGLIGSSTAPLKSRSGGTSTA